MKNVNHVKRKSGNKILPATGTSMTWDISFNLKPMIFGGRSSVAFFETREINAFDTDSFPDSMQTQLMARSTVKKNVLAFINPALPNE